MIFLLIAPKFVPSANFGASTSIYKEMTYEFMQDICLNALLFVLLLSLTMLKIGVFKNLAIFAGKHLCWSR